MYTKTSFLRPLRHLSFTSIWLQQHNPPKGYQAGRRLSAQIKAANINASEQKYDALLQVCPCCLKELHCQLLLMLALLYRKASTGHLMLLKAR